MTFQLHFQPRHLRFKARPALDDVLYCDELLTPRQEGDFRLEAPLKKLIADGLVIKDGEGRFDWSDVAISMLENSGLLVRQLRNMPTMGKLSQKKLAALFYIWRDDGLWHPDVSTICRGEKDRSGRLFHPEELIKIAAALKERLMALPGADNAALNGRHPVYHFFKFGDDPITAARSRVDQQYWPALFAKDLAREVGMMIEQVYGSGARDKRKADQEAFDIITERIRANFPNDAIVGDEANEHKFREVREDQQVWVVDAIDGAVNFFNGIPLYTTNISVGHRKQGRFKPLGAAIYHPSTDDLYSALTSEDQSAAFVQRGSTFQRLTLSPLQSFEESLIASHLPGSDSARRKKFIESGMLEAMHSKTKRGEQIGCGSLAMAFLARGGYHGFINPSSKFWHIVSGKIMIEAASHDDKAGPGLVRSFDHPDREWKIGDRGVIAACNQTIMDEMLRIKDDHWP